MKIWIPIFTWRDSKGKLRYEVHGVFDSMVSNAKKRSEAEKDAWCEFVHDGNDPEFENRAAAKLKWITTEEGFKLWPKIVRLYQMYT